MTVTVSIINSSFYTIDCALARRLQRFLAVYVLDGNTANLLVRAVHTTSNTYVALDEVGERHQVNAVTGVSLPYGTRGCHLQCHQSFKLVYASVAVYMQRELARSVRRRRMGDAALYPSRRPSVLGVVGTSPSSPALRRSLFLLDGKMIVESEG